MPPDTTQEWTITTTPTGEFRVLTHAVLAPTLSAAALNAAAATLTVSTTPTRVPTPTEIPPLSIAYTLFNNMLNEKYYHTDYETCEDDNGDEYENEVEYTGIDALLFLDTELHDEVYNVCRILREHGARLVPTFKLPYNESNPEVIKRLLIDALPSSFFREHPTLIGDMFKLLNGGIKKYVKEHDKECFW